MTEAEKLAEAQVAAYMAASRSADDAATEQALSRLLAAGIVIKRTQSGVVWRSGVAAKEPAAL